MILEIYDNPPHFLRVMDWRCAASFPPFPAYFRSILGVFDRLVLFRSPRCSPLPAQAIGNDKQPLRSLEKDYDVSGLNEVPLK